LCTDQVLHAVSHFTPSSQVLLPKIRYAMAEDPKSALFFFVKH